MRNRNIVLGFILIALGSLWILNNINIIDFNIGNIIMGITDLWPLILVVIGVNIILRNRKIKVALWILFIIIVIVYSFFIQDNIFSDQPHQSFKQEGGSFNMEEGTKKGELELDVGATKFEINSIGNENLAILDSEGDFDYHGETGGSLGKIYLSNNTDNKGLNFITGNNSFRFDMGLNRSIPWDIDIDAGAVDGRLNLKDIAVDELDLSLGAGKIEVNLGSKADVSNMNIESGASKLLINIPEGSGLRINLEGALNSTNLDELNLTKEDDNYISDNFEDASSKFIINIDMGVGKLDINYY